MVTRFVLKILDLHFLTLTLENVGPRFVKVRPIIGCIVIRSFSLLQYQNVRNNESMGDEDSMVALTVLHLKYFHTP